MADEERHIKTTADMHPMLVVRGPKSKHQPMVGLAPGSTTRYDVHATGVILVVDPEDVDPPLAAVTCFRLHRAARFHVEKLGGCIGRLREDKVVELKALRGLGI
jgi:hypothetical protein